MKAAGDNSWRCLPRTSEVNSRTDITATQRDFAGTTIKEGQGLLTAQHSFDAVVAGMLLCEQQL